MLIPPSVCGNPAFHGTGRSFPGKGECNVVPAETKGVVESSGLLDVPRLVRHHVEFDLRVELFEIAGGRNDAVVQRQDRHDALHRTSTAHQSADGALRCGDAGAASSIRESLGAGGAVPAPGGSLGHLVGGAGAVESIVTILSLHHGGGGERVDV